MCGKKKEFTRYLDVYSGDHLADHVGKCNRHDKCGHHYTPAQYYQDNKHLTTQRPTPTTKVPPKAPIQPTSYTSRIHFFDSQDSYDKNSFMRFLVSHFGQAKAEHLKRAYMLGTADHWGGSVVFWQVEDNGLIRGGKVMGYDATTGKRMKDQVTWVHTLLGIQDYNLRQVFYGEHLLSYNQKPIALVESEKTAIVASAYYPQFTWMATGSATGLSEYKCRRLKGRVVVLFPDAGLFDQWQKIGLRYRWHSDDSIEKRFLQGEIPLGYDLADDLLRHPWTAAQE